MIRCCQCQHILWIPCRFGWYCRKRGCSNDRIKDILKLRICFKYEKGGKVEQTRKTSRITVKPPRIKP